MDDAATVAHFEGALYNHRASCAAALEHIAEIVGESETIQDAIDSSSEEFVSNYQREPSSGSGSVRKPESSIVIRRYLEYPWCCKPGSLDFNLEPGELTDLENAVEKREKRSRRRLDDAELEAKLQELLILATKMAVVGWNNSLIKKLHDRSGVDFDKMEDVRTSAACYLEKVKSIAVKDLKVKLGSQKDMEEESERLLLLLEQKDYFPLNALVAIKCGYQEIGDKQILFRNNLLLPDLFDRSYLSGIVDEFTFRLLQTTEQLSSAAVVGKEAEAAFLEEEECSGLASTPPNNRIADSFVSVSRPLVPSEVPKWMRAAWCKYLDQKNDFSKSQDRVSNRLRALGMDVVECCLEGETVTWKVRALGAKVVEETREELKQMKIALDENSLGTPSFLDGGGKSRVVKKCREIRPLKDVSMYWTCE